MRIFLAYFVFKAYKLLHNNFLYSVSYHELKSQHCIMEHCQWFVLSNSVSISVIVPPSIFSNESSHPN